ncbi:hypothetical protein Tco_1052935, partial [Tanacetum coccineum]
MPDNERIPCRIWDVAVPPPDPYSAATQFEGVIDWYQSQGYREPDFVISDSEDSTVTYTEAALQAPPSPDYVPGPKHPPSLVYVPYVPEPVYPEFMPSEDDSDPEEDPEEDDEDPADYPTDRDDGEEEEEFSRDDVDDEEEDEDEDEEEEEEHLALADSVPPPVHRVTARIAAMIWLRAESPSTSHPLPLPSPIVLPYTRASVSMMRATAPSTYILALRSGILPSETPPSGTPSLLPIPLPTPSPSLLLPSINCRAGVSEVRLPPQKRLCIALGLIFDVDESSYAPIARPTRGFRADYGFVGTLNDEIRRDPDREVGYGITDTWDEMDTDEIYRRLDDAQDDRSLMSGQLNMLRRDRRAHARTARLMETEARLSHEAWVQSMDASDTACFE